MRDNKDSLMNVLDAFLHDPLVEWEDEKRKLVSGFVSLRFSYTNLFYCRFHISWPGGKKLKKRAPERN